MRTKLDEKMMHNVRTAVKDADAVRDIYSLNKSPFQLIDTVHPNNFSNSTRPFTNWQQNLCLQVLVILDATEDAAAALAMVNLGPDWRGPPVALVRGARRQP